jgi:hypothetical protein
MRGLRPLLGMRWHLLVVGSCILGSAARSRRMNPGETGIRFRFGATHRIRSREVRQNARQFPARHMDFDARQLYARFVPDIRPLFSL